MKKQLFTILSALSLGSAIGQTAAPDWTTLQSPSFTLPIAGTRFLDALDANVVWLSGYDGQAPGLNYNFFSRTTNGGTSYNSGNIWSDTNTYKLSNLEGIDANTCWVSAYLKATDAGGAIFRTTNGGASWQNMTAPGMFTNTAAFGNWVTFLTPQNGVVNGDPVGGEFELWTTSNGGTSWTKVPGANIPNPQTGEYAIVDIYSSLGPNHVWFGTNQGRVYRSTDAGSTWNVSNVSSITSATSSVLEVRFSTPNNGLALIFQNGASHLYNTFDGGVSWNLIPGGNTTLPDNYGGNEMCNIPGTAYFASAGNSTTTLLGISYSKDNGVTWTSWGSQGIGYTTIDFGDRWHGWAGSFTNFPDNSWPGIFKYDGATFNSIFSIPSSICFGSSSATISPVNTSSSNNTPYTFQWSSSPAAAFSSPTASVPVITFNNVGTYTITLTVNDPSGTGTSTQVINVASCQAPVAGFSVNATSVCNNGFVALTNTSTGGPAPQVTISTIPSNNVVVSGGQSQFSIQFQDPGTYTINMFASSISGTSAATSTIEVKECRPNVSFSVLDTLCRINGTVEIVPQFNGTSPEQLSVQNYTWTLAPINAGVTGFANIASGTVVPVSKRLTLSKDAANFGFTTYTICLRTSNQYGAQEYCKVINVTPYYCLGVDEQSGWKSGLSLYPNPAHDKLNVSLPANGDGYAVKIFNILGATVHTEKVQNANGTAMSIDLGAFRKGVYFIEITSGSESVSRKFIVE